MKTNPQSHSLGSAPIKIIILWKVLIYVVLFLSLQCVSFYSIYL